MAKKKDKDTAPKVSSKDEAIIKKVLGDKKEWLDYYSEKLKFFNYVDYLYLRGAAKKNAPYGRANLELPIAFQQIEPYVAQLMEVMFGEPPYLLYRGRGPEDDESSDLITQFTQWQLEEADILLAASPFFRNLGKYGTAVMKVIWETEYITISEEREVEETTLDPVTGLPTTVLVKSMEEVDIKEHDGPRFYNVPIYDFMVPKSATSADVNKLEWCIHRTYRSLEDILSNPNYKNKDRIKNLLSDDTDGESEDNASSMSLGSDTSKQTSLEMQNSKGTTKFSDKIEVLERWGNYKLSGEKSVPALLVVAVIGNENVVLRAEENPFKFKFKPFVAANDYIVEGEFYGEGELKHIKGLIEESTALRNARLDVANLSLNHMWIVERQAGVNIRELYSAPNKIILTNDKTGLQRLEMGQVTASSVNELARIDFDIQNTTEIINPRQDVSNVGAAFGGTATGVNFLSSRTNLRLMSKARILDDMFFKPLAIMLNKYNKDLVTDRVVFRVLNSDSPYNIGPEAFITVVDYKPTSGHQRLGRLQRKDDLAYLLQNIAQFEKASPGTNNLHELLKEVYKVSGFAHPDKYLNPPVTTLYQTPDGNLVDSRGQPPQVLPLETAQGQTKPPGGIQ